MGFRAVKRRGGVVWPLCFEGRGHFTAFTEYIVSHDWLLYCLVWWVDFLVACICLLEEREYVWGETNETKCVLGETTSVFSCLVIKQRQSPEQRLGTCLSPPPQAHWVPATRGHSCPFTVHGPCLDSSHLLREVMTPLHALGTSWPVTDQQRSTTAVPFIKRSHLCDAVCISKGFLRPGWPQSVLESPSFFRSPPLPTCFPTPHLTASPQAVTCSKSTTQAGLLETLT